MQRFHHSLSENDATRRLDVDIGGRLKRKILDGHDDHAVVRGGHCIQSPIHPSAPVIQIADVTGDTMGNPAPRS